MPKRGYRHLSIRENVFRRLEEIRDRYGFGSLGDAIAYLLRVEEEHKDLCKQLSTLTELLDKITELLGSKSLEEDVGRRIEELHSEVSSLSVRLDMLSRRVKELETRMKSYGRRRS